MRTQACFCQVADATFAKSKVDLVKVDCAVLVGLVSLPCIYRIKLAGSTWKFMCHSYYCTRRLRRCLLNSLSPVQASLHMIQFLQA